MEDMHLFERLKGSIDFQREFTKIEQVLVCEEFTYGPFNDSYTINEWFEDRFRLWKYRENYLSLNELRDDLGFPIRKKGREYKFADGINMQDFFIYCEMIIEIRGQTPLENTNLA